MLTRIFVVILNYRRPEETAVCVESVLASDAPDWELKVILVDNSEDDRSAQLLRVRFPGLELIRNPENLGYAEGNNVGIRAALSQGADYVWVLNNDCSVEKNTLNVLVHQARQFPGGGLWAPLVCRFDRRDEVDSCGTRMDWFRLRPRAVFYARRDASLPPVIDCEVIPGSALFLSKELISRVGLFDQKYFLIHEDADFCLRSLKAGLKNRVVTNAVVYHKISGTFQSFPGWSLYYSVRNFLWLAQAHRTVWQRVVVYCGLMLLTVKRALLWGWTKSGRYRLNWYILGIRDFFAGRRGRCRRVERDTAEES